MGTTIAGLLVGVLATWRLTHLLQAEDGPGDVFVRFRRAVGDGFWGSLLDCFYCLSLWVSVPFAVVTGSTWPERGMLWLALSGGACLLERLTPATPVPPAPLYFEDQEAPDGLLRQQTSAAFPSAGASPGEPDARDRAAPSDGGGAGEGSGA